MFLALSHTWDKICVLSGKNFIWWHISFWVFLSIFQVPAIEETLEVLKIVPDRIGHGTCLDMESGGSQELVDLVLKHKIPLG